MQPQWRALAPHQCHRRGNDVGHHRLCSCLSLLPCCLRADIGRTLAPLVVCDVFNLRVYKLSMGLRDDLTQFQRSLDGVPWSSSSSSSTRGIAYLVWRDLFLGYLRTRRIKAALDHPVRNNPLESRIRKRCKDCVPGCDYPSNREATEIETDGRKQGRRLREFDVESNQRRSTAHTFSNV